MLVYFRTVAFDAMYIVVPSTDRHRSLTLDPGTLWFAQDKGRHRYLWSEDTGSNMCCWLQSVGASFCHQAVFWWFPVLPVNQQSDLLLTIWKLERNLSLIRSRPVLLLCGFGRKHQCMTDDLQHRVPSFSLGTVC